MKTKDKHRRKPEDRMKLVKLLELVSSWNIEYLPTEVAKFNSQPERFQSGSMEEVSILAACSIKFYPTGKAVVKKLFQRIWLKRIV